MMANKRKNRKGRQRNTVKPKTAAQIGDEIRTQIRIIIQQYDHLKSPLKTIPEVQPDGQTMYRIDGADSYELLQDRILDFAGSVWQLKDRLKKYASLMTLDLRNRDASGNPLKTDIEAEAPKSLALMLCADLWTDEKHAEHNNRSGFAPKFNGMSLPGIDGIAYDGGSKLGRFYRKTADPVPYKVEVIDHTHTYSFGHAVDLIIEAFHYWIPLLRQFECLSPRHPESHFILDAFDRIDADVKANQKVRETRPKTPYMPAT